MPTDRATDIVIALHCRVDDDGPAAAIPSPEEDQGNGAASMAGSAERNLANHWPYQAGHGLRLARKVADQMMLRSDSCGTRAVIAFGLPGTPT